MTVVVLAVVSVDGVGGETIISDRDEFEASINLINCAFEVSDDITAAALGCCCISSTNFFVSTVDVCLVKFDICDKVVIIESVKSCDCSFLVTVTWFVYGAVVVVGAGFVCWVCVEFLIFDSFAAEFVCCLDAISEVVGVVAGIEVVCGVVTVIVDVFVTIGVLTTVFYLK